MCGDKMKIDMRLVRPKDVQKDVDTEGSISALEEVGTKARV